MNSPSNFCGSQKQLFIPLCEGCGLVVALLGMTRLTESVWAVLARQVFKFLDKSQRSRHSLGYALFIVRCQSLRKWEKGGNPCKWCKASTLIMTYSMSTGIPLAKENHMIKLSVSAVEKYTLPAGTAFGNQTEEEQKTVNRYNPLYSASSVRQSHYLAFCNINYSLRILIWSSIYVA